MAPRGRPSIRNLPTGANPTNARVASPLLADLLARGKSGGYPADIKLIYSVGGDLFNQCPNVNKIVGALDGVEYLVAQDHFLTPTARYADIVLPATTFWERNDVHTPWAGAGHYAIYMRQAIEPMYECRNDIDIFADLAARRRHRRLQRQERVGVAARADQETPSTTSMPSLTTALPGSPRPTMQWPLPPRSETPSVTSSRHRLARSRSTRWRSLPSPIRMVSGISRPSRRGVRHSRRARRYPLKLCTPKSRARTHSIHDNQPKLARVDRDDVWLHPEDARARGILDGERVRVFNDRGATVLPARVTDRIARGAVSMKEGAWFTPDAAGTDTNGCANVLTDDRSAPCGATTYNTNQVEVMPLRKQPKDDKHFFNGLRKAGLPE